MKLLLKMAKAGILMGKYVMGKNDEFFSFVVLFVTGMTMFNVAFQHISSLSA